jgi:hypothetical protein
MLKRLQSSRRLWLTLSVISLIAIALAVWPTPLRAHGDIKTLTTYYNDAAHTTQVGERIFYCDNHAQQFGTVTDYSSTQRFGCPG